MNPTTRRVAVYLSAGLLLAAMVGFATWASSTPGQGNRAGFTAEAADSHESSSAASTSAGPRTRESEQRETRSNSSARATGSASTNPGSVAASRSQRQSSGQAQQDASGTGDVNVVPSQASKAPAGYDVATDPYMPPHAVVNEAPTGTQTPSRVYRPTNIVPEPEDSSASSATSADQSAGSKAPSEPTKAEQPKPVQSHIDEPESGRQKPEKPQTGQSLPSSPDSPRDAGDSNGGKGNSGLAATPVGDPSPSVERRAAPETSPKSELGATLQAPPEPTHRAPAAAEPTEARELIDRYIEQTSEKAEQATR